MKVFTPLLLVLAAVTTAPVVVDAHGMVTSPRSRQWVAYQDGIEGSQIAKPPREYCYQCANRNRGVCGYTPSYDYDAWKDSTGRPMPWQSQATYAENGLVTIQLELTAHHWGHAEVRACPLGRSSTQACMDANPLEFVRDNLYGMPKDAAHPERGYFKFPGPKYEMQFRLPAGLQGDQVLLQWKYITANSCSPPGYANYFGNRYPESWNSVLGTCDTPYPQDGSVSVPGKSVPEQFFNCMEVTVGQGSGTTGSGGTGGGTTTGTDTGTGTGGGGTTTGTDTGTGGGGGGTTTGTDTGTGTGGGGTTNGGMCCPSGYSGLQAYDNCKSFHHCVNGQVVGSPIPCPAGLLFAQGDQYCDWARSVQCRPSNCQTTGSQAETSAPTAAPTSNTVAEPTGMPIAKPTGSPVAQPTGSPFAKPTGSPIAKPTESPVAKPTGSPFAKPTESPITKPTGSPVAKPTESPVAKPTGSPITTPTGSPVAQPTSNTVEEDPTRSPIAEPTQSPIVKPTSNPIAEPTGTPVDEPALPPTMDNDTGTFGATDTDPDSEATCRGRLFCSVGSK